MKAWVLHGIGDFRLEEADEPVLAKGEVLVSVKAAGICGSDIPRVYRTGTYSYPTIPGHEFSGMVVKTGEGADPGWLLIVMHNSTDIFLNRKTLFYFLYRHTRGSHKIFLLQNFLPTPTGKPLLHRDFLLL